MKNDVHPLRVLLKAIFLFVVVNVVFALINPPVGKITLFNYLVPGRLRFPYEQESAFYFVGFNAPIYEDYDAMFGAHVISRRKPADEFRLLLLGDSATWGVSVQANEMLSAQINRLQIETCDGRRVRAYNLAYPFSSITRDLLILDKAMEYKPDMVFWLITLSTLQPKTVETQFIAPHWQQYLRLASTYKLRSSHFSHPIQEPTLWEKTIIGQRKRLKNIVFTQALGILWGATGIDNHEGLEPEGPPPNTAVGDNLDYEGRLPGEWSATSESLMLEALSAGYRVAGDVPVVVINEPIFVAQGENHLVRYNEFYPRWVFDDYRGFLREWMTQQNYKWLDFWNAVPPEEFSDQYFHRNSTGERRFAELLAREIKKLACP
jgi:lysophospholipase L1-like esterase